MKFFSKHSSKFFNILLITATITPPDGVPFLARTDPADRLKDYQKSLKFYISFLNRGIDFILFAENSNSDIGSLRQIVEQAGYQEQVEFLSFSGLDHPPSYGRAYGEFKLIDYAMAHAEIISRSTTEKVIWKVTGRYSIKNIDRIIARRPSKCDIYCNFRKIPKPWADMYLMAWTIQGYQACLQSIYPKLMSSYEVCDLHPEEVFIHLLEYSAKGTRLVKRISPYPLIEGVKGSDNQNYIEGRNLVKFRLRSWGQKLLPWLWI